MESIPNHEAIIFGTNDPNIDSESFANKLADNFRTVENTTTETPEDIIDGIDNIAKMLGAFSCRRIGVDEYDRKFYEDINSDNEDDKENQNQSEFDNGNKITRTLIEGADNEVSYVHNAVFHAEKNRWRHQCLNMLYLTDRGIIPNPMHPDFTAIHGNSHSSYHNFPRYFKIRRASGNIQDARWNYNEAIKIHQSKTLNDAEPRLYITASYLQNHEEDIHDSSNYDFLFKHVPLDTILEINPDITNIDFRFFVWSDTQLAEASQIQMEVMSHYNNLHHEWRESTLIPVIKRLTSPVTINLLYENNPKYSQSFTMPIN